MIEGSTDSEHAFALLHSLSMTYLVSPVRVPSARVTPITRVVEKVTRVYRSGGSTP